MKHVKKQYKIWTILILWMLCMPKPAAALAQTEDNQCIRVGYYEDGDYMSRNLQGEYAGYNIEFLQEIAKHSGLQFEIIDTGSWNAAYQMLVDGEIDLLPAVYFSEERAREISFVTEPMCSIYTTLNVRMEDERYDFEDYDAFQGMRVGIIKGGVDGERFLEFCQEHQITLEILEYDETSPLLADLDNGTLDGVAITHLGKNSSYRSVAQFSPSSLYFTVSQKSPGLLAEMNHAMNILLLNNPGYSTDLYEKYLSPSSNQKPSFSKAEKQYIEESDIITVSFDPDFAPFSYLEKSSGDLKGVTADIFHFIESNSGLQFQYESHPQSEALELLRQGKVDVLCLSDGDYLWDGRNHINSTLYYLRTSTSVVSKDGSSARNVLALPEGYQLSETVAKDYADSTVQYYASVTECLNAVCQGKADAAYLNTQVAGFFLDDPAYDELVETTLSKYTNKLCIGVSSSADSSLFSILNKCIQYLPAEQTDSFMIKNSAEAKDVSLVAFIEQHTWPVILVVFSVSCIIILLITYSLINALRSNRQIQKLRYKDPLTGLNNLNGFCEKCASLAAGGRQHKYVLLYGDICQFKLINDTFGFAIGDRVLEAYGRILAQALAQDECCGRVSADNFVMLMHYDTWELLLKRLNDSIQSLERWRQERTDLTYKIDFIFGIYLIDQTKELDIHQIMDFANYARLHAKNTPGNFAVLYDEHMRAEAVAARQLEIDLERALTKDEFEVYYQPKVWMENGTVIGSEALIRWNHPQKGFLAPGAFIPLFEKNGMVKRVDLWLLEAVCKAMQEWIEGGKPLLPVSCNFSRLHFQDEEFPDKISRIADSYKIPHDLLEIEITESALMEDSDRITAILPHLKQLGFLISIDDFGSGYSSLGQLQQLDADVLKLDRSFVSQGLSGIREQIVLRNIIHMAAELDITVICEGVETIAQSELLQAMDCKYAQGFYFHRPMPEQEYQKLLS